MKRPHQTIRITIVALAAVLAACGSRARLPVTDGIGPAPALPGPRESLIPTVKIAPAKGWAPNTAPQPAPNLVVSAFARGPDHPPWLYLHPHGDVLVAGTNAPERPDDGKGLKGWFMKRYMKKAGAAVPSANRITLLR